MTNSDDYASEAPGGESPWRTVTRWLIAINVAIFLTDMALMYSGHARFLTRHDGAVIVQGQDADGKLIPIWQPILTSIGYFSVDKAIIAKQVWRFVTYQFCHASIEHVALNMFGLLMAGPLVESRMGRWHYLGFYLACGCMGPAFHILLSQLNLAQLNYYTPLVGASASIYGVLVAAARIAPDEMVMLAIPPIDMKLKNFVLIMILLSVVAVAWQWQNAGGHAAHLGGAVAGWFLSRRFAQRRQMSITS